MHLPNGVPPILLVFRAHFSSAEKFRSFQLLWAKKLNSNNEFLAGEFQLGYGIRTHTHIRTDCRRLSSSIVSFLLFFVLIVKYVVAFNPINQTLDSGNTLTFCVLLFVCFLGWAFMRVHAVVEWFAGSDIVVVIVVVEKLVFFFLKIKLYERQQQQPSSFNWVEKLPYHKQIMYENEFLQKLNDCRFCYC